MDEKGKIDNRPPTQFRIRPGNSSGKWQPAAVMAATAVAPAQTPHNGIYKLRAIVFVYVDSSTEYLHTEIESE